MPKQQALQQAVAAAFESPAQKVEIPATVKAENRTAYQSGFDTASNLHKMFGQAQMTAVQLYQMVAQMEDKEQATAFVAGFKVRAVFLKEHGDKPSQEAGKRVYEFASKLNRVIRSVWGKQVRNEKTKALEWKPGIGREKTLAILTGPGGVKDKQAALDSYDTSRRKGPAEEPVQVRISEAGKMAPAMESLSTMLGVKAKDEKSVPKLTLEVLKGSIRLCPESNLGELVAATLSRCFASQDETWQEFAASARDHLKALKLGAAGERKLVKQDKKQQAEAKAD